eukprot:scaffold128498_cov69-Phaeocystis_antarctica.AAC.1
MARGRRAGDLDAAQRRGARPSTVVATSTVVAPSTVVGARPIVAQRRGARPSIVVATVVDHLLAYSCSHLLTSSTLHLLTYSPYSPYSPYSRTHPTHELTLLTLLTSSPAQFLTCTVRARAARAGARLGHRHRRSERRPRRCDTRHADRCGRGRAVARP